MKKKLLGISMLMVLLLAGVMSVQGLIPDDADGDGVPNDVDQCPAENSSGFDRNGDGCIDAFTGARHIEYWGAADGTVTYVINATAAPNINDGSDITAIQNAFSAWTNVADTDLNVTYGGTVAQGTANGLDHINLVTFVDNSFNFSNLVLAVGLSTSFESDTTIAGRVYRKGEIYDADMLFNPSKTFKVGGVGSGTDIQGVATHEAGHMLGLSHSSVQSSTMFYALPGGLAARTLESDDELVYFKAYGDSLALAGANNVHGTVRDGNTNLPVPGAIVFLVNSASGDTSACDYTLPDGTYEFPGVANGDYYVAIHALDGTSAIGYIQPGNINSLVASTAVTTFGPEWFDNAESETDDADARSTVNISNGQPEATADIITNIDASAPEVLSARPDGTATIDVDGAIVLTFSEAIDIGTIQASFSLREIATNAAQAGNIALIKDDTQIVFTPSPPLAFGTDYRLRLDTDLKDRSGNALAADYTVDFTTEAEPPVSIASLAPNKGIPGTTVVITGQGFDPGPSPLVTFSGIAAPVIRGTVGSLVVVVPDNATTGDVTVTNADMSVSNSITFTVLTDAEFARGFESGQTILPAMPHAIALTPSGDFAYIAGVGGAHAVVVNPALFGYLSSTPIPFAGELVDIATNARGTRAYAVTPLSGKLVEINTDPSTGLLFNTILATRDLGAGGKGIVTSPTGQRAFISTDASEIQVWDIELGSVNYNEQVGAMPAPMGSAFDGALAVTPAGDRLLALTDLGDVAFYDLDAETLVTAVGVGTGAKGITVDPAGERAYVAHDDGDITVLNIENNPFVVQDIATGGAVRRLIVTPAARYLYATDRELDNLKIIDLDETSSTFRTVVDDIPAASNPVDVVMSPGGEYAFSVLQGGGAGNSSPRMLVTTVGIGPALVSVAPSHAPVGAEVVLTGLEFGDADTFLNAVADFNGVTATTIDADFDRLVVTVPPGATTGPVRIRNTVNGQPVESNALFFEVFQNNTFPGLRESVAITAPGGDHFRDALVIRPQGDVCFVGTMEGTLLAFDIRPGSTTFHQNIGRFLVSASPVRDLAVSADGRALFVAGSTPGQPIHVVQADPNSPNFGETVQSFTMTGGSAFDIVALEASPDNRHLVVAENEVKQVELFRVSGAADGIPPVSVGIATATGGVTDLEYHPSGLRCYIAQANPNQVGALNTDVNDASFGLVGQTMVIPGTAPTTSPMSLAVTPDGLALFSLCVQLSGPVTRNLILTNLTPDGNYTVTFQWASFASGGSIRKEDFIMSPRGDAAVRTQYGDVLHLFDLASLTDFDVAGNTLALGEVDLDFEPSGNRVYETDTINDQLRVFELASPAVLFEISGDLQNGVTGQLLSSPLRCFISDALEFGFPVPGVSVTVRVTSGGGKLKSGEDLVDEMVVATDQDGYVDALWQMGTAGVPQQVQFIAEGLVASPVTFTATSAPDPESLPLSLNELLPQNGANNVSATTAIVATFSRAVDPATITPGSLFIEVAADATQVPVTYGFADDNRRVSMTPSTPLSFNTSFNVFFNSGIETPSNTALVNPGSSVFEVGAPPPLTLQSISPPSALSGVTVTLAGRGFNPNPAANTVSFNGTNATPLSGNAGQLLVKVPAGAVSGPVTVTANAVVSNALNFTVLVPNLSPIDDVIATVNTGSGTKSCAITPDGSLCYTISPDGDVVIPVDIDGETTYPAITVGDQPVAIVIKPDGKVAYVANFNSSSVSVIDVDAASPTFNTVLTTITVGTNPSDVAVFPDGDRVLVVNAGSGDLSVIDGDATSVAYHTVISTVNQGSGSKSVAITPDGTRYYVGTSTGFIVVEATSYTVISTVNQGSGSKSVAITPDGTLLFVLTTAGEILIVDIAPGSTSENQVISTVGTGSSSKSVAVSPDGTLLFVILEDTDLVYVFSINVIAGVSAMDGAAPSFTIETALIDQIEVGSDPAFVAVDPSGTGKLFVNNAGDKTLSIINASDVPQGALAALIDVTPSSLNLGSGGKYVTGWIQFVSPSFSVAEIVLSSVKLQNTIPVVPGSGSLGDTNSDGVTDLTVKFDRATFQAILPQGEYVPVTITGDVRDRTFAGEDTIRTLRPTVVKPHGGSNILPGATTAIEWTTPAGYANQITAADIHFSGDNGSTWTMVANHVPNSGSFNWTAPANVYLAQCRVMITLWKKSEVFGQGMNQDAFSVTAPVAVRLKSFDVAVEDGDAVLRWETNFESDMDGFRVVRADAEDGLYTRVTEDPVAAKGAIEGARYEYRDTSIRPNRSYWYKLVEVTPDGDGAQFGPYTVTFRLTDRLDQNMPNPFNPVTTIRYSIAHDQDVSLIVYDVAGRRVRTLVDTRQRADVYRVAWDGRNDDGLTVASGMYFYKLVAGKFVETRKMMLLK